MGQVETLVEAAVLIGNDIKQEAAILFVGVDVMEDHHRVRVKPGGHGLPSPSVDDVNVSLKEDAHPVVICPSAGPALWPQVRDKTHPCHALAHGPAAPPPHPDPLCPTSRAPERLSGGRGGGEAISRCVSVFISFGWTGRKSGPGLLRHQEHSVWGGPEGALSPLLHLIMTLGGQQHASSLEKAKLERIGQAPEL